MKNLSEFNLENIPTSKATKKELEMIREADESGLCNDKEEREIKVMLNIQKF